MGRVIDVAIEDALLQAQERCVRLQQTADYWHARCRERDQLIIRMQRDIERMDWIEKNLCRAGEIRNDEGVTVKLCRVWSVMGELETLRETIDCLMEKTKKEKP